MRLLLALASILLISAIDLSSLEAVSHYSHSDLANGVYIEPHLLPDQLKSPMMTV